MPSACVAYGFVQTGSSSSAVPIRITPCLTSPYCQLNVKRTLVTSACYKVSVWQLTQSKCVPLLCGEHGSLAADGWPAWRGALSHNNVTAHVTEFSWAQTLVRARCSAPVRRRTKLLLCCCSLPVLCCVSLTWRLHSDFFIFSHLCRPTTKFWFVFYLFFVGYGWDYYALLNTR